LYITYSYCILSVARESNLSLCCLFYVTVNGCFYFYFHVVHDVVTVLLISKFVDFYHYRYTFTHRGPHPSAHMYAQGTTGMARPMHRSLVGRGGSRFCQRHRPCTYTHAHKKMTNKLTAHRELKFERSEKTELLAKLLDYFL